VTPHLSLLWAMMLTFSGLSGSSLLLPAGGTVLSASVGQATGKEQDARAEEEAALRRTEAILLKQPGAAPDRLAGVWTRLGWLCLQRQPAEAERLFRKAIDATSKSPPGQPTPAAARWLGLGWACSTQGKHEEAAKAFREALALDEKAFGRDHVKLIGPLSGLGEALVNLRQFEQAEAAGDTIGTVDNGIKYLFAYPAGNAQANRIVESLRRYLADEDGLIDVRAMLRAHCHILQ